MNFIQRHSVATVGMLFLLMFVFGVLEMERMAYLCFASVWFLFASDEPDQVFVGCFNTLGVLTLIKMLTI